MSPSAAYRVSPIGSPRQQHFISPSPRQFLPRCNLGSDDYFYHKQPSFDERMQRKPLAQRMDIISAHVIYTIQDKIYLPHDSGNRGKRSNLPNLVDI